MSSEDLRYDQWIAEALLSVVTRSIKFAATEGLPGEHHFYITFQTNFPGVEMPDHLRARYPDEMTIVLQHQYWDLMIDDKMFEVTLKFSGRKTRLRVPLGAITAFTDPSVSFGLQLRVSENGSPDAEVLIEDEAAPKIVESLADENGADAEKVAQKQEEAKKGEVIALDAFRKK